jgi:hypothetical protein
VVDETRESGFEIDGERYPVPTLDSLDLDEARILYVYADAQVYDFIPAHPDWDAETKEAHAVMQGQKIGNPEFVRALVHIAYRRRHLDLSAEEIQSLIGKVSAVDVSLALLRGRAEEDPPRSSPNELEKTSELSSLERNTDSGKPTAPSSENPDSSLGNIGISESDTSSRESLRIASGS